MHPAASCVSSTTDAVCRPSVVSHHSAPRQCGRTSQQHRCDMPAVLILVAVRAARGSLSCLCATACALFALGIACCMCVYCMHPQHRVRRHRQCLQGYPISSPSTKSRRENPCFAVQMRMSVGVLLHVHVCWCVPCLLVYCCIAAAALIGVGLCVACASHACIASRKTRIAVYTQGYPRGIDI